MTFAPSLKLETPRLVLRPLAPRDVDDHCEMMALPEVARFLSLDQQPQAKDTAWRAFASMLGHAEIRGFGFFSVFEKDSGRWAGRVGPWMPEGWPGLEVGWGIAPAFWGRGYAPEAAIAAINWVFETYPDLPRIISLIDPDNVNSQAVARKAGEKKSGETFKLGSLTLDIWAATREQWLQEYGADASRSSNA